MIKKINLNRYAINFLVVAVTWLYGCRNEEIENPTVPPENPPVQEPDNPVDPLPDNLCFDHVTSGYCDKMSYRPGEQLTVFLQSRNFVSLCKLTIYNINEEPVFSVASPLMVQDKVTTDPSSEGFGFTPTVIIALPAGIQSGIYLIEKSIPFVVKSTGPVDVLVVYPSNTANAYAESGGKSLYTNDRAVKVSFHRPIGLQPVAVQGLKWFQHLTGISVGYVADVDLDDYDEIGKSKVLCLVGHNEYWTREARENFDTFVASGKHALILSGNVMWWQVRYSGDDLKSKLVCYKGPADPIGDPLLKTVWWNDPSLQYPIIRSIGADFQRGGYGLQSDGGWNGYKIVQAGSPLLEGTGLKRGDVISCPTLEYDGAPINGIDSDGYPILDERVLGAYQAELIGFDIGFRMGITYGTFIVLKRTQSSGIIVHTGSTNWCSSTGIGGNSADAIKKITWNAINKLVNGLEVFSP